MTRTGNCPYCGETVKLAKRQRLVLTRHDHPAGGMCPGAYTTPTRHPYRRTRARSTGTVIITCHGDDEDLDVTTEGPWYNICDEHGQLCSHTTLALARSFAAAPEEWCSDCREKLDG